MPLVGALFVFVPLIGSAQLLPGFKEDLSISASPTNPSPYSTVQLSLESVMIDLENTSTVWTVNGKAVDAGERPDRITIQTGAAGSKISVVAQTEGVMGTIEATLTLIPSALDLIVEGQSYVPPFYKGRPLPAPGTSMRLLAIPHFTSAGSSPLSKDDLLFTWRHNGSVIASGKGKSTLSIASPDLFGADTYSVEATSQDGLSVGSASVLLPGIDPQATLYVNHPLHGIEFYNALPKEAAVPDVEMTFIAVPFFTDATSPNDARLMHEWSVNGRSVPRSGDSASEITINSDNSSGTAHIALDLTSVSNYNLHAAQSWTIRFPGSLGGGQIPGTVPQSSTIFHTGVE